MHRVSEILWYQLSFCSCVTIFFVSDGNPRSVSHLGQQNQDETAAITVRDWFAQQLLMLISWLVLFSQQRWRCATVQRRKQRRVPSHSCLGVKALYSRAHGAFDSAAMSWSTREGYQKRQVCSFVLWVSSLRFQFRDTIAWSASSQLPWCTQPATWAASRLSSVYSWIPLVHGFLPCYK